MKEPEKNVYKNPQWISVLTTGMLPPCADTGIARQWPIKSPAHQTFSTSDGVEFVRLAGLQCAKSLGSYCLLYVYKPDTDGLRKIVANIQMKELDHILFPYGFLRLHKEHFINLAFLESITSAEHECKMPYPVIYDNKPYLFNIGDSVYDDAIDLISLYMKNS